MTQHLVKLCVGVDSVQHLAELQAARIAARQAKGQRDNPFHVTRMMPRRGDALLQGGSLFWVIKGAILARQSIVALEAVTGKDNIRRCRIVLGHQLIPTQVHPRRPFQGWRYLNADDAPQDMQAGQQTSGLPAEIEAHLRNIGAW
ncbi:hypothetical protein MNBD_ALPHA06-2247 [hydrothermal vent metagenome]|uniref:Lysophospholipase n=1 Tax=hydrothermal vent metagenome TaxID=652676 RepID=A0A3B0S351_9ZZZZ